MNNELVILAFLTSWCVTSILSKIILLMPSPVMQIGAALVVAFLGGIGAVNASKLQMRSHEIYYAALVVSVATTMMGVAQALFSCCQLFS